MTCKVLKVVYTTLVYSLWLQFSRNAQHQFETKGYSVLSLKLIGAYIKSTH